MIDLIGRLRLGCVLAKPYNGEIDEQATNDLMSLAASEIERLRRATDTSGKLDRLTAQAQELGGMGYEATESRKETK